MNTNEIPLHAALPQLHERMKVLRKIDVKHYILMQAKIQGMIEYHIMMQINISSGKHQNT